MLARKQNTTFRKGLGDFFYILKGVPRKYLRASAAKGLTIQLILNGLIWLGIWLQRKEGQNIVLCKLDITQFQHYAFWNCFLLKLQPLVMLWFLTGFIEAMTKLKAIYRDSTLNPCYLGTSFVKYVHVSRHLWVAMIVETTCIHQAPS